MLIMKLLFEVQCSLHQVYFKYTFLKKKKKKKKNNTFLKYTLRYFL